MKQFAALVTTLGGSTKTNDKLDALVQYFSTANDKDKVWTIAIFSGRRPKRAVNSTLLATWCVELAGIPFWLFEESYHVVGDLAETIALLLPEARPNFREDEANSLNYYIEELKRIEKKVKKSGKNLLFIHGWKWTAPSVLYLIN
jgi:DNA ligase 1